MKRTILILSLCFICIFALLAQEECNTLKIKTVRANYGYAHSNYFQTMGNLDGSTINIDTLPIFYPEMLIVNISNDTFSSNEVYGVETYYLAFADTGLIAANYLANQFTIGKPFFPNDTIRLAFGLKIDLVNLINAIEDKSINFEEISHWELMIGIGYSGKDGYYTDSVFFAGTDTSIFYVTRGSVTVNEIEKNMLFSVFPNPAQSQFTITNTEDAEISLYNILGQKVKQVAGTEENTVIQTEDLSAGIYVVKVKKGNGVFTKKVQINK